MIDCLLVFIIYVYGEVEEIMGESIRCYFCKF